MKKLTAIIMIFVLLLSSSLCAFANDLGLVKALEFCPQSWTNANEELPATRAELCYMAVCLIGNANCEAKDTIFDDVTKENAYSGYIQFLNDLGVVGGVSETSFDPNGNVSLAMATKVFLTVLGYGGLASNYGGYPDGYIQAALNLEILNDVYGNEILSRKDLCTMMHNILVSMPNHGISVVNGTLIYESDKTKGILSERGISAYAGFLSTVSDGYANLTVQKNYYKDQKALLSSGDIIRVDVSAVDAVSYENAPVIIWVDEEQKALYIQLQKDIEVRIGFAAQINGQTAENKEFRTDKLETMKLLDDETEYELENAEIRYNGAKSVSAPYIGKLVRIVTRDDEVISADFYNVSGGGLISEVNASKIIYHNGKSKNVALSELGREDILRVFIDGRSAVLNEIKPDSVFSYYRDSDRLIIAVCEKVVVDELRGISDKKIFIGNRSFNRAETIYCAKDGENYKADDPASFLKNEVVAFVAPNGDVSFIDVSGMSVVKDKFYGVVDSYNVKTFDDMVELKLFKISDAITEEIYIIDNKTAYYDGLTLSEIQSHCRDLSGEGVYVFEIKADKKIKSVSKPDAFAGFGEKCSVTVTSFVNDVTPYLHINGKSVFFPNENIIAIYEADGEIAVKEIKWGDVYGSSFNAPVTVTLYGENQSSRPSLVIMSGEGLQSMYPRVGYKSGFITDKRKVIDENGEAAYEITVFSKADNANFVVDEETGKSLPSLGYVRYQTSYLPFAEEKIVFDYVLELSGDASSWTEDGVLKHGTVKEIDDARLWVEEGDEIYFLHPYDCFFGKMQNKTTNQMKSVSISEIHPGDEIVYIFYGGDIKAILSVD